MERIVNTDKYKITEISFFNGKYEVRDVHYQTNRSVAIIYKNLISYADNAYNEDIDLDKLVKNAKESKHFPIRMRDIDTTPVKYENHINDHKFSICNIVDFLINLYDYASINPLFRNTTIRFIFRIIKFEKYLTSDFKRTEFLENTRCELYIFIENKSESKQCIVHDFFDGSFVEMISNQEIYDRIDYLYIDLEKKINAIPLITNTYQCLIDSSFTGLLVHEVIGHASEADTILYKQQIGMLNFLFENVYYHELNLIDFASERGGINLPSPVFMDNQAVKSKNVQIIKDGIFKDKLHTLETACTLNQSVNGCSKTIYHNQSLVRMRNTILLPGTSTKKNIINSIENGIYLRTPGKGIVKANGNFAIEIVIGYIINCGCIKQAIGSSIAYGNIEELLKSIDMVANDMRITGAFCNKGKETYVGMGGPSLRCKLKISNVSSLV